MDTSDHFKNGAKPKSLTSRKSKLKTKKMATLTQHLRGEGYDLLEGSTRRYKLLQIWLKRSFNSVTREYDHVSHAFKSSVQLTEIENPSLSVDSTKKDEYGFNIGVSFLEEILESLGLGNFEISSKIKSGKTVTISYDNAITREVATGEIRSYFRNADFLHPNPDLLKHANRNNLLIINGVLLAKNLIVEIETDFELNADIVASLNEVVEGKLNFSMNTNRKLKMVSDNNNFFPIAVQAHRIDYDKGIFKDIKLVTDNNIDLFR